MAADFPSVEEIERMHEENLHEHNQTPHCVLLVKGDRYAEVIRKDGDTVLVSFWNREATLSVAEIEQEGFKAVQAVRIHKATGVMYLVAQPEGGTDLYQAGKCWPAVRRKK